MGRVDTILQIFEEMYPNAHCELKHNNVLELLIAVMLSAQTTDTSVNKLTELLFKKYRTADDYLQAKLETLENDLRQIGLYKNKAANIKKTCARLKTIHQGIVPNTQSELEALPGVGRKTANVVLSVWFNRPRIAVDTHVERVAKRLKIAYLNDSRLTVEKKLMRSIPQERWSKTHHQMIFFGRYHCKSKSPHCNQCKLISLCRYPNI